MVTDLRGRKKRLTLAEMAAALGVCTQSVMKRRDHGMPMDDAEAAKIWCEANINDAKGGGNNGRSGGAAATGDLPGLRDSLNGKRAAKLDQEAVSIALKNEMRSMQLQQAKGELLERDVLDELYRVTAEPIKQALDAMPEALGVRCNPTDPEHAASVLRQWATGLREAIAKSLEASAA